jgi:hypothetical protein
MGKGLAIAVVIVVYAIAIRLIGISVCKTAHNADPDDAEVFRHGKGILNLLLIMMIVDGIVGVGALIYNGIIKSFTDDFLMTMAGTAMYALVTFMLAYCFSFSIKLTGEGVMVSILGLDRSCSYDEIERILLSPSGRGSGVQIDVFSKTGKWLLGKRLFNAESSVFEDPEAFCRLLRSRSRHAIYRRRNLWGKWSKPQAATDFHPTQW